MKAASTKDYRNASQGTEPTAPAAASLSDAPQGTEPAIGDPNDWTAPDANTGASVGFNPYDGAHFYAEIEHRDTGITITVAGSAGSSKGISVRVIRNLKPQDLVNPNMLGDSVRAMREEAVRLLGMVAEFKAYDAV